MKNLSMLSVFILILISSTLASCEAIADIFKAGMGFGIFIVIAVIALIAFFVMRAGKK
jgi:predicted small secreted protein